MGSSEESKEGNEGEVTEGNIDGCVRGDDEGHKPK